MGHRDAVPKKRYMHSVHILLRHASILYTFIIRVTLGGGSVNYGWTLPKKKYIYIYQKTTDFCGYS